MSTHFLLKTTVDVDFGEVWSDEFGAQLSGIREIYRTEQVTVYRLFFKIDKCGTKTVIVKCFLRHDSSTIDKLLQIEDFVSDYAPVRVPVRLRRGSSSGVHWVAYEDLGTQPLPWTARRVQESLAQMAILHSDWYRYLEVPDGLQSHTPSIQTIHHGLVAFGAEAFRAALFDWGVGPGGRNRLINMYDTVVQTPDAATSPVHDRVLCHGDAHLGNLILLRRGRPAWIDWEYLHLDSPYFDLFQMLDATSPTTSLVRYTSRSQALQAYLRQAKPKLSPPEKRAWVRGYLKYAMVHLLWILTRIDNDRRSGRFHKDALTRQFQETKTGLLSIQRELTR